MATATLARDQKRRRPERLALWASMLAALLALTGLHVANVSRMAHFVEAPHDSDWFVYLRQAQLFQRAGPIGGLDTDIRDSNTRYLIETAKRLRLADPNWRAAVGPYCHTYHEATDRLSICTPPGAGFLFSLFPAGRQARLAFVACSMAILLSLALTILSARRWTAAFAATFLGLICLIGLGKFTVDWSIPGSAALAVLAGYATVRSLEAVQSRSGAAWAVVLGLALGCAVNFRIANLLLMLGVAAALGAALWRGAGWRAVALSAGFGIAALIGMGPTLAANAINNGSPLVAGYGAEITGVLRPDLRTFLDGLLFYFVQHQTDGLLILAPAGAMVALTFARRTLASGHDLALLAAATNLALTVGFLCFLPFRQAYYPFPAVVFASAVAAFAFIRSANAGAGERAAARSPAMKGALFAACLAAALAPVALVPMPVLPDFARPDISVSLPRRSIVWAGVTSGYFYYFLDRQAAVLWNVDDRSQDRLISAIADDGVPQYVVDDLDGAAALERLRRSGSLRLVGRAFRRDVFEIAPAARPRADQPRSGG